MTNEGTVKLPVASAVAFSDKPLPSNTTFAPGIGVLEFPI